MSSGQPSVENGHSPEENQVSRTSGSWRTGPEHFGHAVRSVREAWTEPSASQYQTGMRCPHQSWREMHQGRMFSIQWKYVLLQLRGRMRIRSSRTAAVATSASGFTFTYHCLETRGSTTVLQR